MQINNRQVIAILIIILALLSAVYIGTQYQSSNSSIQNQTVVEGATKLTYSNDGDTWVHQNVVYENVPLKNGSVQTFYSDMYIQPGSSVTVDLSQIAGYGNQPLPAGTNINILTWKELVNETISDPTADLEMRMQGWSKTLKPQPYDRYYVIEYPGLTLYNLPEFIKKNKLSIRQDMSELLLILETNKNVVHEQIRLKVDSRGRIQLIFIEIPELCKLFIYDPWVELQPTT